ncbi:MAG: TIGR00730 family Rossman fold protein [Actinomycetota bacterium]|nr:TIGR00730 family Rossman fold protein [Acidimicrobiales bacterium]MEC7777640.1 TIGR00730 family Rossman fold protein [Actinomycetota bacterium]
MSDSTATRSPALAVFCGSRPGTDDGVHALARQLGTALADAGVDLVYGGTKVGIMGTLADAVLAQGGRVVGVIPAGLIKREIAHPGLTKLIEVEDMHTRKRTMYALADAFCALPGGYGTLDEVFEAATWTQLGLHDGPKPVVLLDHNGFWLELEAFLDRAVNDGFVKPANPSIVSRVTTVADVLTVLDR